MLNTSQLTSAYGSAQILNGVDLNVGEGEVVALLGRNGVGKSTICDAIEYALTGEIDKYRVEKAAQESLADYIWWRGDGAAPAYYVAVGFADEGAGCLSRSIGHGAGRLRCHPPGWLPGSPAGSRDPAVASFRFG